MFANWKWDAHHTVLLLAFVAGLAGAIVTVIGGLPPGITPMGAVGLLCPMAVMTLTAAFAFFKNPPNDPTQAFEEGKDATKGASTAAKAATVAATALAIAVLGVAAVDCGWLSQNQPVITQDVTKDATCVLSNVLSSGGTASATAIATACAPMTVAQAESIATSLFDYYVLGETDGGALMVGAGLPPYKGIPSALDAADFAKLKTFVTAAAAADGGH